MPRDLSIPVVKYTLNKYEHINNAAYVEVDSKKRKELQAQLKDTIVLFFMNKQLLDGANSVEYIQVSFFTCICQLVLRRDSTNLSPY